MDDLGGKYGRLFWSIIKIDEFCGLAIRIGFADAEDSFVFHFSLAFGSFQFTVGWLIN